MLEIQNVTKNFQNITAVDSISITVNRGDIYGFLGPNGAGKTTLIRMIMGILLPDTGNIQIGGRSINQLPSKMFGYLPEERGLYQKHKLQPTLVYLGKLKGMYSSDLERDIPAWLDRFDIGNYAHRNIQELSKGNQQKVQFISTLIHRPEVVILDEPFTGLDPINQLLLKEIIQELQEKGTTFIFSTHQMEQVEKLCSHLCLINEGKLILKGSVNEVRNRNDQLYLTATYTGDLSKENLQAYLKDMEFSDHSIQGTLLVDSKQLLEYLNRQPIEIQNYSVDPPSIEQIFIDEVKAVSSS